MRLHPSSHRQRGAAAVEMAIIFPLLFMVSYAGIVYGYTFYLQQSINFLAEEATRTALAAADPTSSSPIGSLTGKVVSQFNSQRDYIVANTGAKALAQAAASPTIVPASGGASSFINVTVTLPTSSFVGVGGGFAQVKLLGAQFPPLPANLYGIAQTAVN